jgi:hypothetical protein
MLVVAGGVVALSGRSRTPALVLPNAELVGGQNTESGPQNPFKTGRFRP